jgi:hypothetical protein
MLIRLVKMVMKGRKTILGFELQNFDKFFILCHVIFIAQDV